MTRLRELTLRNIKNVNNGTIRFTDRPTGASVTGIYGPNGSGKTTVITVIGILRDIMSGKPIDADTATCIMRRGADNAGITARFETTPGTNVEYAIELADTPPFGTCITGEAIRVRQPGRRTRTLASHTLTISPTGLRRFSLAPSTAWRLLLGGDGELIRQNESIAWSQRRSYLFLHDTVTRLHNIAQSTDKASAAWANAAASNLSPLLDLLDLLGAYARKSMRVIPTRTSSAASLDLNIPATDSTLDISRTAFVPAALADPIRNMIRQANTVMPSLIPGLRLDCIMTPTDLSDGRPGVKVELHSVRGDSDIPLWAESEGIRRIGGILAYLIRMFNDPGALVAIDELDAGIFEILLGTLLQTLAQFGAGQLIFTAHNLRVLETLSDKEIVFSTENPDRRYVTVAARGNSNLRDTYIRMVGLKDGPENMGPRIEPMEIAMAMYKAANPGGKA